MATYSTDVELGVTTGVALVSGFDAYIERNSGTSVGDSLNDITAATTGNNAEFPANTGSLTGRNLNYFCSNITGGSASTSAPITFTNSSIHLGQGAGTNLGLPFTLTDVNIHSTHPAGTDFNWGIFGDGSGTYAVLDADGHVTTNGVGARGISRPWNWTNVNVFGSGGMRMLINGARPGQSTFTNVNFNPAPGRGAFGELPFLAFADATWGQFYRDDNFPNAGDVLWARITGGMDRNDINATDNWMIQPQWDIRNLDGETAQVAVDGRCFIYFINMNLPADASNLTLRGGQGTSATSGGQTGPTRIIQAYGWNPIINKPTGSETNDIKYVWDDTAFAVHGVPATFTGANTDGTETVPTVLSSGDAEAADFNGMFIIQEDTGSLTSNARADGTTISQHTPRDIHLFSYDTQVNTLNGNALVQNFGRAVAVTPNEHAINADLTWRSSFEFEEQADVFLNGVALTTDFTQQLTTLDHIYPMLKAIAFSNEDRGDDRFRLVPSEGGLRFSANVTFTTSANNEITSTGGNFIVRLDLNAGTSLVSTLDFRPFDGHSADTVDWGDISRTFTGPISILGGQHSNFPTDWTNGLTFASSVTITRPAAATVLDWTNVTIPDGSSVTFPGTGAFSISGLSAAEQGRVTGQNITFPVEPVTNRIVIPTPAAGRYAIRQIVGGVNTEIVPPTDFSAGDTVVNTINDTVFTDPADAVRVYVKYDSAIGGIVYSESEQAFLFNADGSDINYIPQVVADVLVETAQPLSGYSIGVTADGQNVQIALTNNTDVRLVLTPQQSLGVVIAAANDSDYFNAWYNNRDTSTQPIFTYGQGLQTTADARFVTFSSGNSPSGEFIQHQMANIVSAGLGGDLAAGTTVPEITFQTSMLALVDPAVIAAAVDASNTASSVEDIVNYEGYRSQNPLLNGPNGGAINNATDYRNNIRRT